MAMCEYILNSAIEAAEKADAKRIISVNIRAGALRGIKEEFMNFFMEYLTKDTIAEGARLKVEVVPVTGKCGDCKKEFTVEKFEFICPDCESNNIDTLTGTELILQDIEVV